MPQPIPYQPEPTSPAESGRHASPPAEILGTHSEFAVELPAWDLVPPTEFVRRPAAR